MDDAAKELATLKEENADLKYQISVKDQDLYLLRQKVDAVSETFDQLAAAVGWSPARCNQAGDSPLDVALELSRDVVHLRGKLKQAEADLHEKTLDFDALKKHLKDQELTKAGGTQ